MYSCGMQDSPWHASANNLIEKKSFFRIIDLTVRKSDSKVLGCFVRNVILKSASTLKLQKLPFRLRDVISLSQPSNPLNNKALPRIDVAIPCHVKDFENLPLVIHGARASIRNPVHACKVN